MLAYCAPEELFKFMRENIENHAGPEANLSLRGTMVYY